MNRHCVGHIAAMCIASAMLSQASAGADTIRGTVDVIDGATLVVAGRTVRLADIAIPKLGERCIWRERTFDCGKLARSALMDITAGATVVCTAARAATYLCRADDYDLGFGMIHAGWAVPTVNAPSHYHRRMDEARSHKRMLWSARTLDGKPEYALALNPGTSGQ